MFVPKINDEKCKQCGECIDVCPSDVLAANDSKTVVSNPRTASGANRVSLFVLKRRYRSRRFELVLF